MQRLPIEHSKLAAFCEVNGIRKLSLFGSQLYGTAGPHSDIDLLVEFHPHMIPSFFEVARMERELSEMLGGQAIDLKTPMGLSRFFREKVVREALPQYGA
jgi:uncharacterized protein